VLSRPSVHQLCADNPPTISSFQVAVSSISSAVGRSVTHKNMYV
jgi:hypothetical protein